MMDENIKALRKALKNKKVDSFEEGSVITWISNGAIGYRYAVIKAGGRWWITGGYGFYGESNFSYEELLEILSRSDVSDVKVASAWTDVN